MRDMWIVEGIVGAFQTRFSFKHNLYSSPPVGNVVLTLMEGIAIEYDSGKKLSVSFCGIHRKCVSVKAY